MIDNDVSPNNAVILVTGPYAAGKSTFVISAGENVRDAVYTHEHLQQTRADKIAKIIISDNATVFLLEWGGSLPWKYLKYVEGLTIATPVGVVVLFDSAGPACFREARAIIEGYQVFLGLTPYVVAANKQDKPEAWMLDKLRTVLRVEADMQLLSCVATDQESVKQVLLTLLDMIPNNHIVVQAVAKIRSL